MSDALLLTNQELQELTGYKVPVYQIRWLQSNRICYLVGRDGRARVLRSHVEKALGGATKHYERTPTKPNVAALKEFLGSAER